MVARRFGIDSRQGACWKHIHAAVVTGILTVTGAGCSHGISVTELAENATSSSDGSTADDLLNDVRDRLERIAETAEMLETATGSARLQMLRVHVQQGVFASDQLLTHADATDEQVQEAIQAKLRFLRYGVERGWPDYAQKYDSFLDEVKEKHADVDADALSMRSADTTSASRFDQDSQP